MTEKVIIGNATLYHGDCRDVLPGLQMVDCVITDPPYGIVNIFGPQKRADGTRALSWSWDGPETHLTIRDALIGSLDRLRRPGNAFVFSGFDTLEITRDALRGAGLIPKPWAWVKQCPPPPMPGNRWPSGFEVAYLGYDSGSFFGDNNNSRCNVMVADSLRAGNGEKAGHPTQKPLRVMAHIVSSVAAPKSIVLDPFMGSGTTGVACALLGRAFTGIERERQYFDIACRRIEDAQRQTKLFPDEPAKTMKQEALI